MRLLLSQVLLERKSTGNPHNVQSQCFPGQKSEVWWLCVGDTESNELLAIKRVNLLQKTKMMMMYLATMLIWRYRILAKKTHRWHDKRPSARIAGFGWGLSLCPDCSSSA